MIRGAARGLLSSLLLAWTSACSPSGQSLWDDAEAASGGRTAAAGTGTVMPPSEGRGGASAGTSGGMPPLAGTDAGGASAGQATGGASADAGGSQGGRPMGEAGSSTVPPRARQKLEPKDGKTLLLVGQDTSEIQSYASAFGTPSGVMLYSNVWDGLGVLQPSDFGGYGQSNLPFWREQPTPFVLQIGLDLDAAQNCGTCGSCSRAGYLEQLARGDAPRVALVTAIVEALRDTGRPVLLRVGYEFDAEICPGGFGKYPMPAYQQAFKRVREIVKSARAERIALVWNAWAFQSRDPSKAVGVAPWGWYPGDDVVDWIGVSVFPGFSAGDVSEQYQADKRRQLADFARKHGKPLMIAEATPRARYAPQKGAAAWDGWYQGVFDYIEQNDVKAFSYINMNWEALGMWTGRGWGDTRVQGTPLADQWRSETRKPRFLEAGEDLYQELGL